MDRPAHSISECLSQRLGLAAHCLHCRWEKELPLADLRELLGDLSLEALTERANCTACDARPKRIILLPIRYPERGNFQATYFGGNYCEENLQGDDFAGMKTGGRGIPAHQRGRWRK